MKQTAVEYLFGELWNTNKDKLHWHTFLEVAKEIEKEQIMQSVNDGKAMALSSMENQSLEQYYIDTYGE